MSFYIKISSAENEKEESRRKKVFETVSIGIPLTELPSTYCISETEIMTLSIRAFFMGCFLAVTINRTQLCNVIASEMTPDGQGTRVQSGQGCLMQDAGICVYCLGLFLRALASSSATPMATPTTAPIAMFLKATPSPAPSTRPSTSQKPERISLLGLFVCGGCSM